MSRSPIITSVHGRRLGLDRNDALVVGQKMTGTNLRGTSDSTATELANNGYVSVVTTTNDRRKLSDPFPGARVTLMTGSSATGVHSINLNNSVCYSTIGIAGTTVTLTGAGAAVELFGYSTAVWIMVGRPGSSDSAYVSS